MEEETRQVVFETNGKTYKELYDNIIEENLRNPPPEGENTIEHHIRPKSIFPDLRYSRENLVRLTEKVHLLVHYLLWQHYKRETDDRDSEKKMCVAFWNMVHLIEWRGDAELEWITDKYEELRVDFRKNHPMKNPEARAKASEAMKGDKNPLRRYPDKQPMKNPEVRAKHSQAMKRPETRAKISEAMKEVMKNPDKHPMKNPEARAKMSETKRRPEARARASETMKEVMKNPKVRAKLSEAAKEMWKRPEVRAKMSDALKEAMKRPETRVKISEAKKEMWKRPEMRAKISRKVLQYSLDGTFMAEYPSIKEAAIKTNSRRNTISMCCSGKRKTHNGFVWKYAESK